MDRKTVMAAAGALVLTVIGGISALAVAFGGVTPDATSGADAATTVDTVVIIEYVDEAGNPVAAPGTSVEPAQDMVIVTVQGHADPIVAARTSGGTSAAPASLSRDTSSAPSTASTSTTVDETDTTTTTASGTDTTAPAPVQVTAPPSTSFHGDDDDSAEPYHPEDSEDEHDDH